MMAEAFVTFWAIEKLKKCPRYVDSLGNESMSSVALFTYLKASDIPFLGFWSKPKPRWFGKPENKFDEYLRKHSLRENVFDEASGTYIALVFAWIELKDRSFAKNADPVTGSLQKHIGGAHWIVLFEDRRLAEMLENSMEESQWTSFLREAEVDSVTDFDMERFDGARNYVRERILELKEDEAVLVSVG